MIFKREQIDILRELKTIADRNMTFNDKRVANALHGALDVFAETLKNTGADKLKLLKKEFEQITDWDDFGFSDELLVACHNTAQYERGLEIIEMLVALKLGDFKETAEDKAAFLAAIGRQGEAEGFLKGFLDKELHNTWLYRHHIPRSD